MRFFGTTPSASNIKNVYLSTIKQLNRLFDLNFKQKTYDTIVDIRNELSSMLELIKDKHPNKKLVILYDSIDQLIPSDYDLIWFITTFPNNVKMIYSTLSQHGNILEQLHMVLSDLNDNFLEITTLNSTIVKTILEDWLLKSGRLLTEKQWSIFEDIFSKADLYPLYVKLVFDIISKWPSYFEPEKEFYKNISINDCIKYLFGLLEIEHGINVFRRILFYYDLFPHGIAENELEDILSLDDDLLINVFEYHAPPIRRFPLAIWTRIKHELKEYFVEREIDDTIVIYW